MIRNKGFMVILVAMAVFIIAITLLSINTKNYSDYSNEFLSLKNKISNYEFLMHQKAIDCNWDEEKNTFISCVDSNSDLILSKLNNNLLTCMADDFTKENITPKLTLNLSCSKSISVSLDQIFKIDLNKNIIIKRKS